MTIRLDRDGYYDLPAGKVANVTTYLEMTEPPPRSVPDLAGLTLRRVERADLAWYRDLYRRIGAEWLWFSRLVIPDADLARTLHDPAIELHILALDGSDEGILELDLRAPPDIELSFFGLTPALVGRRAGRWLMARALELAWRHRPRRFWLHTCTFDHPAALAFYQRSGFRPYRRSVEVADDPRLLGHLPATAASWLPVIGAEQ